MVHRANATVGRIDDKVVAWQRGKDNCNLRPYFFFNEMCGMGGAVVSCSQR